MTVSTPSRSGSGGRWTRKRVLSLIGFIALLAVLAYGVSALFGPGSSRDSDSPSVALSNQRSELADAKALLESGETTAALAALESYSRRYPADTEAKVLIDALKTADSGSDSPDPDVDGGTTPEPEQPVSTTYERVDKIETLLPAAIPGWSAGIPDITKENAGVSFDPVSVDAKEWARKGLFQVHDLGSEAEAKKFLGNVSKVAFPDDGTTVRIGVVEAYFGTDGADRSTVAFARGPYAFELVIGSTGVPVDQVQEKAVELAGKFPATK